MISIAVIEDNLLVREGLSALLNQVPDLSVVAGESGVNVSLLQRVRPQVILLDLGLRSGDSVGVAAKVRLELPESRVIVMDLLAVPEDIEEFVDVGVAGFIMKDATLEDLVSTIRLVAKGVQVLPPHTNTSVFARIATEAAARHGPETLHSVRMTKREREVIDLISKGLSNKEIAERLEIATHTVKSHVRNIMEKLVLHTRLQIAAYAHNDRES